jgi:transcription elongation factor Elf1
MPDKKCPLCDSTCILKVLMDKSPEAKEVDVCSMCGASYPKEKGAEKGDKTDK